MKPDRLTRAPAVSKQPVEHVRSSNPRESGRPLGRSWWARTGSTLTDAGPVSTRNTNRCLANSRRQPSRGRLATGRGCRAAPCRDAGRDRQHRVAADPAPGLRLRHRSPAGIQFEGSSSRASPITAWICRSGSCRFAGASSRTSPSLAPTCWKRNRRCRTSTTS